MASYAVVSGERRMRNNVTPVCRVRAGLERCAHSDQLQIRVGAVQMAVALELIEPTRHCTHGWWRRKTSASARSRKSSSRAAREVVRGRRNTHLLQRTPHHASAAVAVSTAGPG